MVKNKLILKILILVLLFFVFSCFARSIDIKYKNEFKLDFLNSPRSFAVGYENIAITTSDGLIVIYDKDYKFKQFINVDKPLYVTFEQGCDDKLYILSNGGFNILGFQKDILTGNYKLYDFTSIERSCSMFKSIKENLIIAGVDEKSLFGLYSIKNNLVYGILPLGLVYDVMDFNSNNFKYIGLNCYFDIDKSNKIYFNWVGSSKIWIYDKYSISYKDIKRTDNYITPYVTEELMDVMDNLKERKELREKYQQLRSEMSFVTGVFVDDNYVIITYFYKYHTYVQFYNIKDFKFIEEIKINDDNIKFQYVNYFNSILYFLNCDKSGKYVLKSYEVIK